MSTEFDTLKNNITNLKAHFFLNRYDPAGDYTDEERLKVVAYLILVHGEFENYFETICLRKALMAVNDFKRTNTPTNTILGLLAFTDIVLTDYRTFDNDTKKNKVSNNLKNWESATMLSERVQKSFDDYSNTVIPNNHGIKRANLLDLLLPIGFPTDLTKFNFEFFDDFDKFGKKRGDIVHHSSNSYIKKQDDPYDYERIIQDLIDETEKIDLTVESI